MEYFDCPRDNRKIYDPYVIDCVPEREDRGCLQLSASTSNLEEVRTLLDGALDQRTQPSGAQVWQNGHCRSISGLRYDLYPE